MPDKNNPPDKYELLVLTGHATNDINSINDLANQGFRVIPVALPYGYLLFGGYSN